MLHIGTDKTGSTALQEFFAGNAEALGRHGFVYLKSGRNHRPNHTAIHEPTLAGDYSWWRRLAKELMASPMPRGLVSFEGFYHLNEAQLRRVRKELAGLAVKIVIYLRRQSDMVRSGVAQRIKSGQMNLALAQYTPALLVTIGASYESVLARFGAVFGRDNLLVRRYEHGRWPEQNIFLDFLGAIGIGLDGRALQEQFRLPPGDSNPTLDVESLHLLDT
ncbi:MAG TPA: hypothetical protein VF104_00145, partial [Burkholderiales bacterium]